jgi:hypothetical protein
VREIPTSGGAIAGTASPACYRVAVFSGSLEVTARIKSTDDLELLLRVLKAHEYLFTPLAPSLPSVATKIERGTNKFFTEAVELIAKPFPKPDAAKIENLAKVIEKACPAKIT